MPNDGEKRSKEAVCGWTTVCCARCPCRPNSAWVPGQPVLSQVDLTIIVGPNRTGSAPARLCGVWA